MVFDFEKAKVKIAELDVIEEKRIAEIRGTESDYSGVTGTLYYVSADGDDANDGLSENAPLKSIRAATVKAKDGDGILLRRGDMWRTPFTARSGVTYSAYGKGAKPIICGSPENGADPEKWFLVYENKETGALIWQYYDTGLTDIGAIFFNGGECYAKKELPSCDGKTFVCRYDKTKIYDYREALDANFKYFHAANSIVTGKEINAQVATGPLYLRCDNGNPGKVFDSIEFNVKTHGIRIGGNDITIDNLCIKHAGAHGISAGTVRNLIVKNCEIGWIGGSIQGYNANASKGNHATRFGNGVEVYGGCDNYVIDNCYIYQCYDAGVTHQYSFHSRSNCRMEHIRYTNCVLVDNVYNIEYFLSTNPEFERCGDDILFENTICRRAGFGFGSDRPDGHNQENIRSGTTGVSNNPFTNYRIKNCIFDRSVYDNVQLNCPDEKHHPKMEGNTYIQGVGNRFGVFGATSYMTDENTEDVVRNIMGDKSGEVYFTENIPYYEYKCFCNKTAEVTDEDYVERLKPRKDEAPESREVFPPFYIRSVNAGDICAAYRPCERVEKCEENGMKYIHITPEKHPSYMLLDCMSLPEAPLTDAKVYFKVLMRSNTVTEPAARLYSMKDIYGTNSGGGSGTSINFVTDDGRWTEAVIRAVASDESASFAQIHLYYCGTVTGEDFFDKDGKPINPDVYYDIAAWAAFPNLESAKQFNLKENI
ncbi:MAG: right-handed parallel beta-helix repeat-containing protein [Clostridia bacterium]|nr:right-handed parallel beta-helix repeat-containing protein [Clostridia bacterium]